MGLGARGLTVYLNAASHGLPADAVTRRIAEHIEQELRVGPVAAQAAVENELVHSRVLAARLIGGTAEDTGLAGTSFEAWTGIVRNLDLAGKRLLVAPHEWGDNVRALRWLAAQTGARVEILPVLDLQSPDLSAWQAAVDEDVAAIFVPMVTAVFGWHYPVEAIGTLARPEHSMLIVDAAQALGRVPVDVAAIGCDALVGTTRKWVRGPKQTALFWVAPKRSAAEERLRVPALEPLDFNVALRLGQGVAIDGVLRDGIAAIRHRLGKLASHAREKAHSLGLGMIAASPDCTTATLFIPAECEKAVKQAILDAGCVVKWPLLARDEPCSSEGRDGFALLRLSAHIYNTDNEIDRAFDAIARGLEGSAWTF